MKPGGIYSDPIIINQYMSDVGDGTGTINAVGDYSSTAKIFFIQPAVGEIMTLTGMFIHLVDSGSLTIGVYGGLAGALSVGLAIRVTNEGSENRSIIPGVMKTNGDLVHMGSFFNINSFSGGVDSLSASINFSVMGAPLILEGGRGHKLEVVLNDDFVGLNDHHFLACGFK